jgi:SAM-dependent methyltransferase
MHGDKAHDPEAEVIADNLMGLGIAQMTFLRTMQVHVVRAKFSAIPFPDQTFQAVIVNDVLEHLAVPKRLMGRINNLLVPGGLVILEVPNAVTLYKRIKVVFGQSNYFRFENFYRDEDYRGHVREYTKLEVQQMLRESGFQPLQCRCINQARRPRFEQANASRPWAVPLLSFYHVVSSVWDTWRDHVCCVGRKLDDDD